MQEKVKQKISLLHDGELHPEDAIQLLEQIREDPESKALWHRYHAISFGLKSDAMPVRDGFAEKISQAIDNEPVVLAPIAQPNFRLPRTAIAMAASILFAAVAAFVWLPQESNLTPEENLHVEASSGRDVIQQASLAPLPRRFADTKFNDYLVTHSYSSPATATQGVMSYARVASYRPKY